MNKEIYWTIEMSVFAFNSKEEARAYEKTLIDLFCAAPESEGFCAITSIKKVEEDV